jgi:hypothetical protein
MHAALCVRTAHQRMQCRVGTRMPLSKTGRAFSAGAHVAQNTWPQRWQACRRRSRLHTEHARRPRLRWGGGARERAHVKGSEQLVQFSASWLGTHDRRRRSGRLCTGGLAAGSLRDTTTLGQRTRGGSPASRVPGPRIERVDHRSAARSPTQRWAIERMIALGAPELLREERQEVNSEERLQRLGRDSVGLCSVRARAR